MTFDLLATVDRVCKIVGNQKSDQRDIMLSVTEEVGELAVEIKIANGLKSISHAGPDGIVGEAVDSILCLLDVIHSEVGTLTNEELHDTFRKKLDKWRSKYAKA